MFHKNKKQNYKKESDYDLLVGHFDSSDSLPHSFSLDGESGDRRLRLILLL